VVTFLIFFLSFWTGFDLNLPLDDFGAVDFDYLQNVAGNFFHFISHFAHFSLCSTLSFSTPLMQWLMLSFPLI
jgi:hypothetical protein